jgi:hypothetical protein
VLHRHHDMLAGAVDMWEVAAGLEARGVTDADARRLRHRDVFGLAEELVARTPRNGRPAPAAGAREPLGFGVRDAALHLMPAVALALAAALGLPGPAAVGLLVAAAWPALRRGPLRVSEGALRHLPALGAVALLALARCGPHPIGAWTLAALALTLLPAAWLARWFACSARAQLAPSHSLADFADAVRPRLLAVLAGYAAVLLGLLAALGTFRGSALGALLLVARLLAVHGAARPAAAALAAALAAQAVLLVLLPAVPAGTTEAAACGTPALALTVAALRLLPRAAAHRT